MVPQHYPIDKLSRELVSLVSKYLDRDKCSLFCLGSRVDGTSNERSEIEVGIEREEKIPLNVLLNIQSDLEEMPILNKIDFVDFKSVGTRFYHFAKQKTEPIA